MAVWLLILLSLFLSSAVILLLSNKRSKLPPGPIAVPILGNLLWLRRSVLDLEQILLELRAKHGPIVTLHVGSRPAIFISDRSLAHKALIEFGAASSDRPAPPPSANQYLRSLRFNISSAGYGPRWRLLRRNLASEILQPSRVKIYSEGRQWVLGVLIQHLRAQSESGDGTVVAMETFQFTMFCLLVLMCFGEKLDEKEIKEIEIAQRDLLLYSRKLNVFAFVPQIAKYVFRNRWVTSTEMHRKEKEIYAPLIETRREHKLKNQPSKERFVYSYLDSLLDIDLPEEGGRKLTDEEMVSLCSEFLNAGTDTTSTTLEWIMAELVKHQELQEKLFEEIEGVAGSDTEEVKEEVLQKMPYLKAVIMEGLRRHPPAHFLFPHSVTKEITIDGYVVPKNASINFMVAEMGRDEKAWEKPMEFKPERFLGGGSGEGVDITGSREIKMMPFGAGRRVCPGIGIAMLHLEYFVANLVREFEWKAVGGEEIDMSEKPEFTTVMKNPLRARLIPRRHT